MQKPDLELLEEVLDQEIDETSREAFQEWRELLLEGRLRSLQKGRREWLERVADQKGIDTGGAQNLISSGQIKVSAKDRASLADFHKSLGPKLIKPPGRK